MSWSLNPFIQGTQHDGRRVIPADPIAARLPIEAAEKLATLKGKAAEASAVYRLYSDQFMQWREEYTRAENDLALLLRGYRRDVIISTGDPVNAGLPGAQDVVAEKEVFRGLPDEDVQVQQARERVRHGKAELDRATQERNRCGERTRALNALVKNTLIPWIERWPASARLSAHAPISVNAKLAGNLSAALEKCRSDRQHHLDKLEAVQAAPLPSAEAKRLARLQIASLAKRGEPTVLDLIDHRQTLFRWPMSDVKGVPDAVAILAWFDAEGLIRRVEETIDQRSDDANALSDNEKNKRIADIKASVLYAERMEEAIICAAEQSGMMLLRRVDADPRAVLGLSDELPPEA